MYVRVTDLSAPCSPSPGEANKVKLLQSLGLSTTLFTDGHSPINLFNTAQGLIGALPHQSSASS